MKNTGYYIAAAFACVASSVSVAQSVVDVRPQMSQNAPPSPVDTPWIAEADVAKLRALSCVEYVGAYRPQLVDVLNASGLPKQLTQVRMELGALKALGWLLPESKDETASVWISEPALAALNVTSRAFPLTLNYRLSLMGQGPSSKDQPVEIAGLVTAAPHADAPKSPLLIRPAKVLKASYEKLSGDAQMEEAVPPNIVLRVRGDAKTCAGQIAQVVDGWSNAKRGSMKFKTTVR